MAAGGKDYRTTLRLREGQRQRQRMESEVEVVVVNPRGIERVDHQFLLPAKSRSALSIAYFIPPNRRVDVCPSTIHS